MNFLNFLTSGANSTIYINPTFIVFNFNLQALSQQSNIKVQDLILQQQQQCDKTVDKNHPIVIDPQNLSNTNSHINDSLAIQSKNSENIIVDDGGQQLTNNKITPQSLLQPNPHRNSSNAVNTAQQQLINQYMHLNLQLLSQKINHLEHIEQNYIKEKINPNTGKNLHHSQSSNQPLIGDHLQQQQSTLNPKNNKKKIKKFNTNCEHTDRQHYAKGMCNNCYHKNGRTKKPWKCSHEKLYANGLCQNCYINKYNKMKREKHSIVGEDVAANIVVQQKDQQKQEQSNIKMESEELFTPQEKNAGEIIEESKEGQEQEIEIQGQKKGEVGNIEELSSVDQK